MHTVKHIVRAITSSFLLAIFLFFTFPAIAQTPGDKASITFSPEQIVTSVGESFSTELWLNTDGVSVGGVGAKINFDPTVLQVESIQTHPIFPDYPATMYDNQTGKVVISGIVQSADTLYMGNDQFATVTWKTLASGTTTISLSFEPNQTQDSNIAVLFGNGDILQQVNSVQVSVAAQAMTDTPILTQQTSGSPTLSSSTSVLLIAGLIGVMALVTLAFGVGYWFSKKKSPVLKEEIPHIQTPPTPQPSQPPEVLPPSSSM
jgi:hypothetical protein